MMPSLMVVGIGRKSIELHGEKKDDFLYLPNARLYKDHTGEDIIIPFDTEIEWLVFLQRMIDEGVPFFDSDYPDGYSAYFFAKELVREGKLKGRPIRAVWEDGEYRIEDADD